MLVQRVDFRSDLAQISEEGIRIGGPFGRHFAVESLRNKARRAARDIDVFADQIAIDARDKIFRIEVDVLDFRTQLGRDVIAQPFRIHADVEIA